MSEDETVVYLNPVKVLAIILLCVSLAGVGWLLYVQYWDWRVGSPSLFAYALGDNSTITCTGGSACVPIGVSANVGQSMVLHHYGIVTYTTELGDLTNYHLAFVAGLILMVVCLSLVLIRRFGRTE